MNQMCSRPPVLLVTRAFIIDGADRILLLKRSKNDTHNAGLWEAPGGKAEEGQDLNRALEDEVMQETGLVVHPSTSLSHCDSYPIMSGKYAGMLYLVIFGICKVRGGKFKLSHEHDDFRWVTYHELFDFELTQETRKAAVMFDAQLRVNAPSLLSA